MLSLFSSPHYQTGVSSMFRIITAESKPVGNRYLKFFVEICVTKSGHPQPYQESQGWNDIFRNVGSAGCGGVWPGNWPGLAQSFSNRPKKLPENAAGQKSDRKLHFSQLLLQFQKQEFLIQKKNGCTDNNVEQWTYTKPSYTVLSSSARKG